MSAALGAALVSVKLACPWEQSQATYLALPVSRGSCMRCLPCGTGRSRLVVACQVTKVRTAGGKEAAEWGKDRVQRAQKRHAFRFLHHLPPPPRALNHHFLTTSLLTPPPPPPPARSQEQRAPLPQQLAAGLLAVTSAAALALTVAPMDAAAVSGGGGPSEGLAGA